MAASFKDRPVARILMALVGVILGLLAAKFGMAAFNNRPGAVEAQFEQAVQTDPNMGPMFQAMQQYFPSDYAALKTEMATQHRAGASNEMLTQLGFARLAAFRRAHLRDIAHAPAAELAAFRASQAALANQLAKESESMCARFTFATLAPTDRPSAAGQKALAKLPAEQADRVTAVMVANS
jgi:DICT domain-containing protein